MPAVPLWAVVRGEFSPSNDGEMIIGWFLSDKGDRKIFGRLKKAAWWMG